MALSRPAHAQRGVTLVPTLLLALTIMASGAALTSNALHRYAAERARGEQSIAAEAAESGLDVALYELESGGDLGADGLGAATGAVAGGRYAATIAPAFAGAGTYTITSVGSFGPQRRTAQRVVTCTAGTGIGLLGLTSVSVTGTPGIDSYDSTKGTYASQVSGGHAGSDGNVASNGNISGSGSGTIFGDARPGPTGSFSGGISVDGSTAPAQQSISVTPYVYNAPGKAKTSLTASTTLTGGIYHYKSVSLSSKDLVKFSGNVTLYVDGSISTAGQAAMQVLKGANVTIYQGSGSISLAGGGIINDSTKPSSLQIQSATTSTIKVSGSSAFYGTVFAATADFSKSGTAQFFGSVVANTVSISGTGWIHYDSSLAGSGPPTFAVVMTRGW
jgi:hypothetical protein